uniref:Ras-related protein Rab-26 n=1 Tax=Heterorhabditis bacteriophora TaxID=37862 RepID=A0A1I7WMI7_HETBA
MDGDDGFDYLFKIVLIGDMGVGKTCVVQRFRNGTFVDRQGTTIGVDFTMKTLVVGRLGIVIGWIDDVSKFAAPNVVKLLVGQWYFLLYDQYFILISIYPLHTLLLLFLATKCDLEEQRVIEREEGEIVQRANGMFSLIETSARSNLNVDGAFLELATILKRQYDQCGHHETSNSDSFRLGAGGTTPIGVQWRQCCRWQ